MKEVELLAPAGSFEALIAAVQNGANAVYLGGKQFGARAFANNFDIDEMKRAVAYAHIRNVRVYVTINTLVHDDELKKCLEYVHHLYQCDVDAVIVQDLGVARAVREVFPELPVHASTQMSIANARDAQYYADMGFTRIVVARENSLAEIERIREQTDIEIEAFVHGALCISYSGKCLFSYVNGGRSANRGECAQPCRQFYEIEMKNGKRDQRYYLSARDLSTIRQVPDIIKAGVHSFKIEGRMKRAEYVATAVRSYRKAIDAALEGKPFDADKEEARMAGVFNRTFTKGFLLDTMPSALVNSNSPKNIGVLLGTIVDVDKKIHKLKLQLDAPLAIGDGTSLGEHVGRMFLNGQSVSSAPAGSCVTLDYIGERKRGEQVRKTSDKGIIETARASTEKEQVKIPIFAELNASIGKNPSVRLIDSDGNIATFTDDQLTVDEAKNKALENEAVRAQLEKLESTPYQLQELSLITDGRTFLRKSDLNHLRRSAVAKLDELRSIINERSFVTMDHVHNYYAQKQVSECSFEWSKSIELCIRCRTKEQLLAASVFPQVSLYVDSIELYKLAITFGRPTYFVTPIILKDAQIDHLLSFIDVCMPNIVTTSLGFAEEVNKRYQSNGIKRDLRLDYMFNAVNHLTYQELEASDLISSCALSIEARHIGEWRMEAYPFERVEFPLYLHPTLMVTEFCPYKADTMCTHCKVDSAQLRLDNKKIVIHRDQFCRQTLLDQDVYNRLDEYEQARSLGISKFRIELLKENAREVHSLIQRILDYE